MANPSNQALRFLSSRPAWVARFRLSAVSSTLVSDDGQRFLMNALTDEATRPITVILNWNPSRGR